MTGKLIFCICLAYFVAAYFIYGGYLGKLFALNPKSPTPAKTCFDGVDYVPTPPLVLFGHHFASIAGPGPIVGPIMAAYFGWLPALIWILAGCVFIGAFHDFAAMVISVRNKGRSISFVMEKLMGYAGRQLFLAFCLACLLLIVAIFTILIAGIFVAHPEVASASLMFIMMAPLFTLATYKYGIRIRYASLVFVPLVFCTVPLGQLLPCDFAAWGFEGTQVRSIWILILALYIFCASLLPVQWLLQPRDYLNSWLLYGMLLLGFAAILFADTTIEMDSFKGWQAVTADGKVHDVVPNLFIFVACGACSGFHALVASGTTSKQIRSEKDIQPIGYGAMLLEGVLGVMALVAVMTMSPDIFTTAGKNPTAAFAGGLGQLAGQLHLGSMAVNPLWAQNFIALAVSAFMLTSLDTATRLGRFLVQEVFMPKAGEQAKNGQDEVRGSLGKPHGTLVTLLGNKYSASLLMVGLSMILALSGEAASIWPIFGASNQLMAALTFLVITLWLLTRHLNFYLALLPMLFMMVMSLWGIVEVVKVQWGGNLVLVGLGVFLIVMALLMVALGISVITHNLRGRATAVAA
ncbi:MAG: carbon starvation protein A [Succinivibrio sp.]|nr:carbon starvation protein A [Succinivibrio sp.]